MPGVHEDFVARAVEHLSRDERLVGLAIGGSYVSGVVDDYSDLDFVVVVEPAAYEEVMRARREIVAEVGPLLAAFTGEHVGEPRLIISLYASSPPLHVDWKFVSLDDVARRVEDPRILFERDGRVTEALRREAARFPHPDPQWIEDRFWIWIHYAAAKIGRGELFEALDFLTFLRGVVLGPLALARAGARPSGVRRIEQHAPEIGLQRTVALHDATSCARAVLAAIEIYRDLRPRDVRTDPTTEHAATAYLQSVIAAIRVDDP